MNYRKRIKYINQYKYTSTNQHGARFKEVESRRLSVSRMTAKITSCDDLSTLAVLSDQLDTPIRYDFDSNPQTAWIEVISNEQLKG